MDGLLGSQMLEAVFPATIIQKCVIHQIRNTIKYLQTDLDIWIQTYNQERTHSGKYCFGKTPYQTFQETKQLARNKMVDTLFEKEADVQIPDTVFADQVVR